MTLTVAAAGTGPVSVVRPATVHLVSPSPAGPAPPTASRGRTGGNRRPRPRAAPARGATAGQWAARRETAGARPFAAGCRAIRTAPGRPARRTAAPAARPGVAA